MVAVPRTTQRHQAEKAMTTSPSTIENQHRATSAQVAFAAAGTATWLVAGAVIAAVGVVGWGLAMLAVGVVFGGLLLVKLPRLRRSRARLERVASLRDQQQVARRAQRDALTAAFGGTLRSAPSTDR